MGRPYERCGAAQAAEEDKVGPGNGGRKPSVVLLLRNTVSLFVDTACIDVDGIGLLCRDSVFRG